MKINYNINELDEFLHKFTSTSFSYIKKEIDKVCKDYIKELKDKNLSGQNY